MVKGRSYHTMQCKPEALSCAMHEGQIKTDRKKEREEILERNGAGAGDDGEEQSKDGVNWRGQSLW